MKEVTHTVFVSSVSHSSNLMTSFREENKTQVLDVASITSVTNTSQLINPVTIAPSTTVEVTVLASRANQDREHLIKKLFEGMQRARQPFYILRTMVTLLSCIVVIKTGYVLFSIF